MSASSSTPASEVSRPPSKATRTALPAIDDDRTGQALRSGRRPVAVVQPGSG